MGVTVHCHLSTVFSPVHRDTKKPRGFTFCQYRREEDAADAVRGMSGRVSMGGKGEGSQTFKFFDYRISLNICRPQIVATQSEALNKIDAILEQ